MGDVAFGVWKNSVTSLWRHYDVIKIGVHIKNFTHSSYSLLRPRIWKLVTMGVYWPIRKISVTSLSHDSHVTKTSKSNNERTMAVRANCDYAYGSLSIWALTGLLEKISVTSLSYDSHVTKTIKSNCERTIWVRAYCHHTYESMSLWAFIGLLKKLSDVTVTW